MTALRIAAQAALDALVESVDLVQHDYDSDWRHGMPTRAAQLASSLAALNAHKAAIDALRAALAEPEHQGDRLQMLLRRSRVQLRKWAEWYGSADHAARGQLPLPPAGDVELAEDISGALPAPSAEQTPALPNGIVGIRRHICKDE